MFASLPDDALRQYIDARTAFVALELAKKAAKEVRGGMYWKKFMGNGEYLIRTSTDNSQTSLGVRSAETEAIFVKFAARKATLETRVNDLKMELE